MAFITGATVTSTAEKPEHGVRYVITRARALSLMNILHEEFPMESSRVVPIIKHELEHGTHNTHICFYVPESDCDAICVIPLACAQLLFKEQETF